MFSYINANYVNNYFNGNESLEENKNTYKIISYEVYKYVVYYICIHTFMSHAVICTTLKYIVK